MVIETSSPGGRHPPDNPAPLGIGAALVRLAAIGAVIAIVPGCFLYTGGFLSPRRLMPAR